MTQAAEAIETLEPQTLEATEQDVQLAKAAKVVEAEPAPALEQDVQAMAKLIALPDTGVEAGVEASTRAELNADANVRVAERIWDRQVRQWSPDWVEYDEFYRPVILNPYRNNPVQIIYVYQNAPRIVWIPPLARIVLEVAQLAAYSFTAVVLAPVYAALNAVNTVVDLAQAAVDTAVNVAVGTFFGGGFVPAVGQPLPPPPPPVLRYDNVPVQVRYTQAVYEPFRVNRIIDVGEDPVFGERKVLLDGVTPAWGVWTESPTGERLFEVHRTQQFPGLDDPQEAPIPGGYQMTLVSEDETGLTARDIYLAVAASIVAVLGLAVLAAAIRLGRREQESSLDVS